MLNALSWFAVAILSISYWFQIWKIHIHKEVRDLSLMYHFFLAVGFAILGITAYIEQSVIFLVKQIITTIPVCIIIGQIFYHKKDRWYDPNMPICIICQKKIENNWQFCPFCGAERSYLGFIPHLLKKVRSSITLKGKKDIKIHDIQSHLPQENKTIPKN